ncbi:MAG: DUF1343 domain-containing protein [Firmicutes bacterium]|nr:DUF1343 domain-containing protein [Bacillota bacterium]
MFALAHATQDAAECDKGFIVLDRPNPINGIKVEGNVSDPRSASFVGLHPIATRHGFTIGELAGMFNEEFGIGCDLKIARMKNWQCRMWYDQNEREVSAL